MAPLRHAPAPENPARLSGLRPSSAARANADVAAGSGHAFACDAEPPSRHDECVALERRRRGSPCGVPEHRSPGARSSGTLIPHALPPSMQLTASRDVQRNMRWRCATCGEDGVVRGWEHCNHDLSDFVPCDDLRTWMLDGEEREYLHGATRGFPDLRAVIMRASPHARDPRVLVVRASVEELDELYTLVEELTDFARSRREHELLDGLRASLCTSMDGF